MRFILQFYCTLQIDLNNSTLSVYLVTELLSLFDMLRSYHCFVYFKLDRGLAYLKVYYPLLSLWEGDTHKQSTRVVATACLPLPLPLMGT